ncbi:MAG: 50S ribosomal protein L15 [Elusimicrobiota bacterium]|nr:50S ribosomal protein L15 [Elusimicrobiota bacterium]
MSLSSLRPAVGSKHRKKIVGRGVGSGHGRTATRGSKGQKSRSGDGGKKVGFEGGQMPLFRRIPKRGHNSARRRIVYEVVNVNMLNKFDSGVEITSNFLKENGIVKSPKFVKILGNGELTKSLHIKVLAFSRSALNKIRQAGGKPEFTK